MIFKNWFKPKWQHPDYTVRQQSIASLSAGQREHKEILHELAFNDSSETVRRSALEHLNDFSLWWQSSKQDSSDRLRQHAEQQLLGMLLGQQITAQLKSQFIAQCNRSSLLEQLAERESDAEMLFRVLQRLNKPELNSKALTDSVLTIAQKQHLLTQLDDQKQLEKLSKVLTGELAQQLQQKLAAQAEQQQKPVKLRKDITLLLARLNALRERFSAAEIPAQLAELQRQWQGCLPDLDCLPVAEADSIRQKYQQLITKLEQWLAPQLQELAQAKAEAEQQAAAQSQFQQLTDNITQLNNQLGDALAEADISAAEAISEPLANLTTQIAQATLLNDSQRHTLHKQQQALASQLNNLPKIAENLSEASRVLTDWAAQPVPSELANFDAANEQFTAYKKHWQQLTKSLPLTIPVSLATAKQQLQQQWQQALAALNSQQERTLRQCRSKLSEFKRLDQQGRFKVLFGLFKGISSDYAELSPAEQLKVATDYEQAAARIAELTDWQEYIATPRKQELLAHLQQLASIEPTDMPARAEQVKQARTQWGSFGKAEAEQDAELNTAFDLACEQAYAPCRGYFAEQDAIKAANLAQRETIVSQLEQLDPEQLAATGLDAAINAVSQAWQQAGPVKRQDFVALQQRYQQALSPLKAKAGEYQQQAALQKQGLVNDAIAAVALSDSNQSSKILKELQQRWKSLGYAGKKQDQQLWQQFRKVCDGFFSQRQAAFAEQQQQQLAQENELTAVLAELEQAVAQLTSDCAASELEQLNEQLKMLDVGVIASARKQRDKLRDRLAQLQQQQAEKAVQQGVNRLFAALMQADNTTEHWPAEFKPQPELAGALGLDRKGLTQALEIVCGVNGPEQERSERQQVQLTLLTLKHNAGELTDKHNLLQHWLAFGPLMQQELSLVPRVKALFISE
tara:strand:+ start:10877 stop:13615 length:2739 start_codon:yes stop_codon:yes gene_type:complete